MPDEPIVLKDQMLPVIKKVSAFFSDLGVEYAHMEIQAQLQYEAELNEPAYEEQRNT